MAKKQQSNNDGKAMFRVNRRQGKNRDRKNQFQKLKEECIYGWIQHTPKEGF